MIRIIQGKETQLQCLFHGLAAGVFRDPGHLTAGLQAGEFPPAHPQAGFESSTGSHHDDARFAATSASGDADVAGRVWLENPSDSFYGFGAIRRLLVQLQWLCGVRHVIDVLRHDSAAYSFLDHRRIDSLSTQQLCKREYYAARYSSNLSHNWYLQRPLTHAIAALLAQLMQKQSICLVVPILNRLDIPSIAVLNAIYGKAQRRAPDLLLGYYVQAETPRHDRNDIDSSVYQVFVQRVASGLATTHAVPILDVDPSADLAGEPSACCLGEAQIAREVAAFSNEERAARLLQSRSDASDEVVDAALAAVRASFASSAFGAAVRFGLELLDRRPDLRPQQLAELHGMIALAAHNTDLVRPSAGPGIKELLRYHYEKALESEGRAEIRSALCYRLAVTYGRRMKNIERGLYWADRALREAQAEEMPQRRQIYYEVWARNIKSYLLMLSRDVDGSFAEGECAFGKLEAELKAMAGSQAATDFVLGLWQREFFASQMVICENMITLGYRTLWTERYLQWLKTEEEIADDDVSLDVFRAIGWRNFYEVQWQLQQALPWAFKCIETARAVVLPDVEQHNLLRAISVLYRLGRKEETLKLIGEFSASAGRIKAEMARVTSDLDFVDGLIRMDQLEQAEEILERYLRAPAASLPCAHRAQLTASLGLVAANRGSGQRAEQLINAAIDSAAESNEHTTLLNVAIAAAKACRLLGRTEEMREAYAQALSLMQTRGTAAANPEDQLEIYLGLHECGHGGKPWIAKALGLFPAVLEHEDAWWQLPRLLAALRQLAQSGRHDIPAESESALAAVLHAASQRQDCATVRADLLRLMPSTRTAHPVGVISGTHTVHSTEASKR